MQFLAHLHPLLVHLPIGILLMACFLQLLAMREKYSQLAHAVSITLFWGMISAIASCITGYLLSGSGDYDPILVSKHQWFGISVAIVSVIYYQLYQRGTVLFYQWVMPVLLILLITITGHLGGSITHGSDYLTGALNNSGKETLIEHKPITNVQEAVAYTDIIQPVLQAKCYSCHGTSKQKGKLRMDLPDLLMKGGKDGVVIEAGKADESEMIKRILLDKSDEHHMPPKEKPQLTEKEVTLLHWWIASGASFNKKTKDLSQDEKLKPILLSLQNTIKTKESIPDVPATPVEKADEKAIQKLKDMGVVLIPVAANSNYLSASFVTASNAHNTDMLLLLPLKKQLVWLKLSDTKITDSAAAVIAQCSNLSKLQLDSTGITDTGLAELGKLLQLQSLNLVGTKITVSGLMTLKNLPALRQVYVYKTGVKSTDWSTIKNAFPKLVVDTGGYIVPLLQTDTMLVQPPKNP